MRLVFMGTSEFAVPSLESLIAQNADVIGVVTQPDRPSGRGRKLTPPPVKVTCHRHSLEVYQPEKLGLPDFIRTLRELRPDVIVVVAFGQLIPKSLLHLPPCGCINIHPSLLPKYRGAAPIQWALINGETETGITVMLLDETEDTGDIILQQQVSIDPQETAVALTNRLAHIASKALLEAIKTTPTGAPPPHVPQDHRQATHAPRLTKESGHINWRSTARSIFNLVRGTAIWPGAYTFLPEDLRLKVLKCQIVENAQQKALAPGMIEATPHHNLTVGTGNGVLQLDLVQPANKQPMSGSDFLNGYRLNTGTHFLHMPQNS